MTTPITREELLARIDSGWRAIREAVATAKPDQLDRPTSSGWTGKELIAHLAFWEETVHPMIVMFRGQPELAASAWYGGSDLMVAGEWPSADIHNAREAAWARTKSVAEVISRWDAAHTALINIVGTLSAAEVLDQRFFEIVSESTVEHFAEHLLELSSGIS
jgi:hypothetical protein